MPELLFIYGTLRDRELLAGILDRRVHLGAQLEAAAPGFRAVHYGSPVYPALVRAPGSAATGLILTDLSGFEFDLLDAYEGERYRRDLIPVMIGEELHEAFAYLPVSRPAADALDWSLERWRGEHKPRLLEAEIATAALLRQSLLANRPN